MNIPQIRMPGELDLRSLGIGLGIVVFLYLSLLLYAFFFAGSTLEQLESKLASHKIMLISAEETQSAALLGETEGDNEAPQEDPAPEGALIKSPVSGLVEETDYGKLPIVRSHDRMTSFQAYKRPFPAIPQGKTPVAILVTDIGLSPKNAKIALELLPPEVSFLLSPYAQSPETWRELARRKGHESWLNIPVENKNIRYTDPGPAALLIREDMETAKGKLYWSMARTTGYAGLASFNDELFLMAQKPFRGVFKEGLERGLAYLELNPAAKDYLQGVALNAGMPYLQAEQWIYRAQGENSFDRFEQVARQKGYALGIVPPWPQTMKMLELWTKTLEGRGMTLVPVSAIAELQKGDTITPVSVRSPEQIQPHALDSADHVEPERAPHTPAGTIR